MAGPWLVSSESYPATNVTAGLATAYQPEKKKLRELPQFRKLNRHERRKRAAELRRK